MSRKTADPSSSPTEERALERLRGAWSRAERSEPPELLDQAVLNAARREVAGAGARRLRWAGAFATAAVLLLALTLFIHQRLEQAPIAPPPDAGDGFRLEAARTPAARSAAEPAAAAPIADEAAVGDDLSAEDWIARLRALRDRGAVEELAAERARFLAAYPEYPLPADLRE